jgi:hypothetical protein
VPSTLPPGGLLNHAGFKDAWQVAECFAPRFTAGQTDDLDNVDLATWSFRTSETIVRSDAIRRGGTHAVGQLSRFFSGPLSLLLPTAQEGTEPMHPGIDSGFPTFERGGDDHHRDTRSREQHP